MTRVAGPKVGLVHVVDIGCAAVGVAVEIAVGVLY